MLKLARKVRHKTAVRFGKTLLFRKMITNTMGEKIMLFTDCVHNMREEAKCLS